MRNFLLFMLISMTGLISTAQTNTFPPSGNVGIGTTSPGVLLHVYKSSGDNLMRIESGGTFYSYLSLKNSVAEWQVLNNSDGSFAVTNPTTERFHISSNGNVGIGTANPQSKLAVNGDIFSKKVKVIQTGWPDYVFHDGYPLMPLTELHKYIHTNKHLPEVPSGKEVEKNGLDLGENQSVLLKKIEELTLYIIDQQKQIDELKMELNSIKSK